MKIVNVEKLSFSYDGEHPALRDVSFSIEEGSYVGYGGLLGLRQLACQTVYIGGAR